MAHPAGFDLDDCPAVTFRTDCDGPHCQSDNQRRIRAVAMKARPGSRMISSVQLPYRDQGVG